jgi:hypothetical protein
MPASHSVVSVLLRSWETFLYTLKAGPAGGRLRRPSSRRQRRDGHRRTGPPCTLGSTEERRYPRSCLIRQDRVISSAPRGVLGRPGVRMDPARSQ